jgi:hypothetical protein
LREFGSQTYFGFSVRRGTMELKGFLAAREGRGSGAQTK